MRSVDNEDDDADRAGFCAVAIPSCQLRCAFESIGQRVVGCSDALIATSPPSSILRTSSAYRLGATNFAIVD